MDWSIKRNYEKRKALISEAAKIEKERDAALDMIDDIDDDDLYDLEFDAIWKKYDTSAIYETVIFLEYPESGNEWYKNFVKSFGVCENKRISHKQAEVFMRYCEANHDYEYGRGQKYYGRCGNLGIECMVFTKHEPAYLKIIELRQ